MLQHTSYHSMHRYVYVLIEHGETYIMHDHVWPENMHTASIQGLIQVMGHDCIM